MSRRSKFLAAVAVFSAIGATVLFGQAPPPPNPNENPESNTGALREQITTAGSYDAHSGNATRIVEDLHLPSALGKYGLDFTRYWNSLHNDIDNTYAQWPLDFGSSGWSHSWRWTATEGIETWQRDECGGACGTQYWETSITIGFPDGHSNKYKITRADRAYDGQPPGCGGRIGWGPPYLAQCGEREWQTPGLGVHDRLSDMAQDGSEFWLHLADGGSVHFVGMQATEVFDPNGFRTDLHYRAEDGRLDKVTQEGGRWLDITWGYRASFPIPVIVQVQSGGFAGIQTVIYNYNRYPDVNGPFLVLTSVNYPEGTNAVYTYGSAFVGDDPNVGPQSSFPLLKAANDPRYPGAMTRIRYDYYGGDCPPPEGPPNPPPADYYWRFYPQPYAIGAEKSGDTTIPVSRFAGFCASPVREETNGFGAIRKFYFGNSAGVQGGLGYGCMGFQLAKVTDFYTSSPSGVPFGFQNFLDGQPRQVWDGRNILTDLIASSYHTTGETGDDSGQPSEVRHTGSGDGSVHYYDRIHPGDSEARDVSRIHNPSNHWLFSQTDEGGYPTTYVRDSRMRIKDINYYVTAEHYTYNDYNQVTSHTLPSGAVQTYVYDATHRLSEEYNSVDGWDARKQYIYDDPTHPDLVHKVIDARARASGAPYSTRMEYNGRNQIIEVHYAPTGANPDPHVSYEYTDGYGNCTAITDEMGHRSTYQYDSYRRCISYTEPLNAPDWSGGSNVGSRTWNWIYDRWIDGIGQRDASAHTKNEWRIQIEPAFNAAGDRRMTARAHDVNNRIVIESSGWIQPAGAIGNWYWSPNDGENHYFGYDANGQKNYFKDPQGRETTYDYDLRNRLWKTNETVNTIPRTTETLYDVNGNKTMVKFPIEAAGQRSQQWLDYDGFGQPGRFIDERGNPTNLIYCWGPMKKLYKVITHRSKDGGGVEDQPTTFSYDLMGKPTQVLFPDGSHEDTTYYCAVGLTSCFCDQPHSYTTRKGQQKIMTYDARGREISHTWSDVTPGITRIWDDANRMTSISNIFSTITYQYDDASQVQWERNDVAGSGAPVQTSYLRYGNGKVAQLQYPDGIWVYRQYTARGQLQSVWDSFVGWQQVIAYTYRADGKVDYADYQNGVRTNLEYDGRGMTEFVEHFRRSPYQNYSWRQYWRDERDRITAFQKSTNNAVNPMENGRGDRFRYDAEGQMIEAWYNAANPAVSGADYWRYDGFEPYDALGNRTGWKYVSSRGWMNFGRRDNGLNQYASWENEYPDPPLHWGSGIFYDDNFNADWQYPGNGVMMAEGRFVGSYNALNQPKVIIGPSNWVWFGYDPLGRCVKRWNGSNGDVNTNPAKYFYYEGWNLIEESQGAGSVSRNYVHGARVDEIVKQLIQYNPAARFFHYDARGHCTLQTDTNGNIAEQYEYDAFGYPYFFDANGTNIGYSPWGNRFLFAGREWLSDLRLFDFRARMYQPELGRFLQPDPKHFAAGDYNLYRYCHNDPVNHTDPSGTYGRGSGFSDDQWKKVAAAQRAAANAIDKTLKNMTPKSFAKTFGAGSATPENMQKIAQTLRNIAAALRDNGDNGFFANAATAEDVQSLGLSPNAGGFIHPSDNQSIYINVDHPEFGGPLTQNAVVHESGHNMGLIDFKIQRLGAYQHGDAAQQDLFRMLPTRFPAEALTNADTVTSLVFP